jgi:hypothetical protein
MADQSPHQLSNLAIYLKSYRCFETSKHRPRCLLVPPASQSGAGEFRNLTDRIPNFRKCSCFVHATESRPGFQRALHAGLSSQFQMFAVPVCAFWFCADGPGQPFSNGHGLETSFPHCTVALSMIEVFLRIDVVETVLPLLCGWILRSTHEGIFASSPRHTLDRPGVPTTLPYCMLFIQLLSWRSCHIVQGPTRLGPPILSFSSSVKLLKQKKRLPNHTGRLQGLKIRETTAGT